MSVRLFVESGYPGLRPDFRQTVLALSGGGAKGSFQLGVVHLLQRSKLWDDLDLIGICGTSVGSINALGLAPNTDAAIDDMRKVWMGLRGDPDMYIPARWVEKVLEGTAGSLVEELFDSSEAGPSRNLQLLKWKGLPVVAAVVAGMPVIGALIAAIGTSKIQRVIRDIEEASTLVGQARYLVSLQPVAQTLLAHVSEHGPRPGAGLPLRLVSFRADSGSLAWMDENAVLSFPDMQSPDYSESWRVFRPHTVRRGGPEPELMTEPSSFVDLSREQLLVEGALASSAIPVAFPGRSFFDESGEYLGHYLDGGVRDVIPAGAVSSVPGARTVVSASAGTVELVDPFDQMQVQLIYSRQPVVALAKRAIRGAIGEVHDGDVKALDREFEQHLHIAPHFEVHDTTEIDPGGIRINACYGYMRAFDEFKRHAGEYTAAAYAAACRSADTITRARRQAWWNERGSLKYLELEIDGILPAIERHLGVSGISDAARRFISASPMGRLLEDSASGVIPVTPAAALRQLSDQGFMIGLEVPTDDRFPKKPHPLMATIQSELLGRSGADVGKLTNPQLFAPLTVGRLVFDGDGLEATRSQKKAVGQAASARLDLLGEESMPVGLEAPRTIADWSETWELHYGRGSLLHRTPFQHRQLIVAPSVVTGAQLQLLQLAEVASEAAVSASLGMIAQADTADGGLISPAIKVKLFMTELEPAL